MNTFINIFFIFIFIFAILFFKLPNIDNRNRLLNKLILFSMLFIYQFMLLIISKVKNKCKIDFLEVFIYSIETATLGVIGYSIYNDLEYSKIGYEESLYMTDNKIQYVYIALIIALLLIFVNTIKLLFGYRPYECIKYD